MNNSNKFPNLDHQELSDTPKGTPDQPYNPDAGKTDSSQQSELGSDDENLDDGSGTTEKPE
jgi:hypothetical protein